MSHPQPAHLAAPAISDGGEGIYLAVLAVLLALLAFTIWREFHSLLRPWLR